MSVALPSSLPDAVAHLENVHKVYRLGSVEVPALRGVTLTVPRGEFTFLVGPSGSGKSTLLNLLGCIDRPTTGTVTVMGQDVLPLSDNALADFRARHVGIIFQSFNLLPVLSVLENVEYPLVLAGVKTAERRATCREMLDAVGLGDRLTHRPGELSGGQRQRVAIARALAGRPDLVLADEPTANLDSRTGAEILELMLTMQQRFRTTFVFSTHDPEVMRYAHSVHVLQDGCLIERRAAA